MDNNSSFSSSNPLEQKGAPSSEAVSPSVIIAEVAQDAKQVAEDLAMRARRVAEQQLANAKRSAANRIGSVADALRATGDQLRDQDVQGASDYVDEAVERLDAASGYLQDKSFGELISDVEGFARREPAIFLGGAFILGLLGGRFLKSSGSRKITRQGGSAETGNAFEGSSQNSSSSVFSSNAGVDYSGPRGIEKNSGSQIRSGGGYENREVGDFDELDDSSLPGVV